MFFEIIYEHAPWQARSIQELLKKLNEETIEMVISREIQLKKKREKQINDQELFLCNLVIVKCLQYEEHDRIGWDELFVLVENVTGLREQLQQ